jgi:hypothetical protein
MDIKYMEQYRDELFWEREQHILSGNAQQVKDCDRALKTLGIMILEEKAKCATSRK